MYIHQLSEKHSVLHHFLSEIRDQSIQKDRMRFRRNIERIGEILTYEMSMSFSFSDKETITPLGKKGCVEISNKIVVCSILRAGLPLHQGIINYLDGADCSFISAYRCHTSETDFEIHVEYLASQDLDNKTLILADPMLATGQSILATFDALTKVGLPKEVHILSVIGARPGIAFLQKKLPKETHLWIGDIDAKLNEKGYIIPGLGDAGDLAFGEKLQK
ncbi:uracil phosphoribosyltransferase [Galbibacter pacificus]|uniref:Uracil phosphoribosyltransferase n=1 Tax=Galbibacter pacificus TaxID=2996052 RepID=A0ABT6FU68_9FLAO|nr:uracil phosphoribosyltransferase [Galbibacter pacificus]MDG3583342.1 uracil phosphoribosyltransferase [Galbibacter pacificus]MDG3586823.1 uracil phosphoribosyltransferase [Galbibacter pacificus]